MNWILTDNSNSQYVRKHSEYVYEVIFIQKKSANYDVCWQLVNVAEYMSGHEDDLNTILRGYGYADVLDVYEIYGDAAYQIIAECISETVWELSVIVFTGSKEECERYIENLVRT